MILWRPVGLHEMALIFDAEMKRFPPRLPDQPIFYPVLVEDYANQIAGSWNTKDPPFAGYPRWPPKAGHAWPPQNRP
jgi:hypothetical protein